MKLFPASFFMHIIFLCTGLAFSQTPGVSQTQNAHQELACDIFRELVEINTTVNMGSTGAAEAMAARLRNAGFPESDINIAGGCGYSSDGYRCNRRKASSLCRDPCIWSFRDVRRC